MEILIPYYTKLGETLRLGRFKYEYQYLVTESFMNRYYSWLKKGKEEILIQEKNLEILLSEKDKQIIKYSPAEFVSGGNSVIGIYTGYTYNGIYVTMSDEMAKHIDDHIKITMVWIADRGVIQCLIQPRLVYCKDPNCKSEDDFII